MFPDYHIHSGACSRFIEPTVLLYSSVTISVYITIFLSLSLSHQVRELNVEDIL